MPDPLTRGAVVVRDGAFGVVWTASGDQLVLLPVVRTWPAMATDVVLSEAEASASFLPRGAAVRAVFGQPVPADGHLAVGCLPGPVMCRVVQCLVRAVATLRVEQTWADKGLRREQARDRCVNLLS